MDFPLFSKISVAGDDKHPLYETLTQAVPERIGEGPWWKDLVDYGLTPNEPPEVLWNFEKFLINKNGEVVARFARTLRPMIRVLSMPSMPNWPNKPEAVYKQSNLTAAYILFFK